MTKALFLMMVVLGSWGQASTQTETTKPAPKAEAAKVEAAKPAPPAAPGGVRVIGTSPGVPGAPRLGFAPAAEAEVLTVEIADLKLSDDGKVLVKARSTNPLDPRLVYFRLGGKLEVLKEWMDEPKPNASWQQMTAADGLFVGNLSVDHLRPGQYSIVVFLAPKVGTDFVFSEPGTFTVAAK